MSKRSRGWIFIPLFLFWCPAHSQDSAAIRSDTGRATVRLSDSLPPPAAYHPKKSAWLAVGLSAVAPGAGQIYDANYWKAPVIWGLGGYWVYEWIHLNDKYREFRDAFDASLRASSSGNSQYLTLRDFYRDERDRFAWFLGGLYFLNLLDAYVGANLYDFDVGPDLGTNGFPGAGVTATIRWKF